MIGRLRHPRPLIVAGLAAMAAAAVLFAQLEPGDRGIAPVDSSASYEVSGVVVDIVAKDADTARMAGWREAQRRGWKLLWGRLHGQPPSAAPTLPDSTLDSIVSGISIEDEQVSATRYIGRLGVLFDRGRAGGFLGVHGQFRRSQPMLVIPLMWSGGVPTVFEQRTDWQRAWARFRTGSSSIDYVRPIGNGIDPLLLNAAQARRPGRAWWRMLLDQYGAADILTPEAWITRAWPGGPVTATFVARHGPDGEEIARFTLTAPNSDALPAMLDEGVKRIDAAYAAALQQNRLEPDPSLLPPEEPEPADVDGNVSEDATIEEAANAIDASAPAAAGPRGFTLQVETPDAQALSDAETAVRGVPGVQSSSTTSLALGGVSVIRISFSGDPDTLGIALAARGWRVEGSGATLRLRRAGGGGGQ